MGSSRKIVSDLHRGKGPASGRQPLGVERLTVARAGPVGQTGFSPVEADTYVDPFPYVSLGGVNPDRLYPRRGDVMAAKDESRIHRRTNGTRVRYMTQRRETEGRKGS